jgi:GAF domain-containing protein
MTTIHPTDADPSGAVVAAAEDREELAALREIVQLGTTAPTWDELMQLIVDRSTVAMGAEVCSLYLVDRDREERCRPATHRRGAPGDRPGHHRPRC